MQAQPFLRDPRIRIPSTQPQQQYCPDTESSATSAKGASSSWHGQRTSKVSEMSTSCDQQAGAGIVTARTRGWQTLGAGLRVSGHFCGGSQSRGWLDSRCRCSVSSQPAGRTRGSSDKPGCFRECAVHVPISHVNRPHLLPRMTRLTSRACRAPALVHSSLHSMPVSGKTPRHDAWGATPAVRPCSEHVHAVPALHSTSTSASVL